MRQQGFPYYLLPTTYSLAIIEEAPSGIERVIWKLPGTAHRRG